MINGIINVYKEAGFTSHDVVAKLRGILKQKKIGHTGTLDPDATGVLPVCLGKGTKLCDMLTDRDKTYEAVMLLGKTTDTQDISGTVQKESPVGVTEEELKCIIDSFIGNYDQVPPMYSALKVNGRRLYELAREGKEVERQARRVHIYEIKIEQMELPRVKMTVACSKGTYIRTLCDDIGEKAGCGACMESLKRVKAGSFDIKDSLTLSRIEELVQLEELGDYIVPVDAMFAGYPEIKIKKEYEKLLLNGNVFYENHAAEQLPASGPVRVYDGDGRFFAIYEYYPEEGRFQPVKIFGG